MNRIHRTLWTLLLSVVAVLFTSPAFADDVNKYALSVVAKPTMAGSFNTNEASLSAEEEISLYAYANSNFEFKEWVDESGSTIATTPELAFTMPARDVTLTAIYEYNPENPANPATNYWNSASGEVIIDDFTPGRLSTALYNIIGDADYSEVQAVTVAGAISSNDFGIVNYYENCTYLDLSRVTGVTEVPWYAFDYAALETLMLPATIEHIGSYAFYQCSRLSSLTLYALVPPTLGYDVWDGVGDDLVVYVPASALALYQEADAWKDLVILPITTDAHVLQVNLPSEAADGRYKNNTLELVNVKSGARQKYVISDRLAYTFNGLQKEEQFNVYLYSQAGLEIGRIEQITIPDDDITVTFDQLKSLYTVSAQVIDAAGKDVTSDVTVEWYQPLSDGTATYLRKAASLGEIPEGQTLTCRVTLNARLGAAYVAPGDVQLTVSESEHVCRVTLSPFRTIVIGGTVVDGDGSALSGAVVTANQTLNGKYTKTYGTKTDRDGQWTLSVLDAPETAITYAASECVNQTHALVAFDPDTAAFNLGTVVMRSIVGARITYGFTYQAAGSEAAETYYPDYQNVAISVYNVTQNRAHQDVSQQYPLLAVLDETIQPGDELLLTASSKTGAFSPIETTVTVGENRRGNVIFDIVGKGGIKATFGSTENAAVVAMLYSAQGELLKKSTYSGDSVKFSDLEGGSYTVITMGQSDLMSATLRLSNLTEIGLIEGTDYVKNSLEVEDGRLAEVQNAVIPAFDESVFYYTNSSANFSVNKSSITTGNYLTLRSAIDFKDVYKNGISNVALVIDLPESCSFVEQSVIQGTTLLPYTFADQRLTIQLGNNYTTQTRFCVMPTSGGTFNASAAITFDYQGKTVTQPIGLATSEIKDLEITVPATITDTSVTITGSGKVGSQVKVYANGEWVGETQVLKNGLWSINCPLTGLQNLQTYAFSAILTTPDGVELHTATKSAVYDKNAIKAKSVLMTFYNGWLRRNVEVVFDFDTKTTSSTSYMFYTTTTISFIADLSQNSPDVVSGVTLYVYTDKNETRQIDLVYDQASDRWVGSSVFYSSNLPVNLSISIDGNTPIQHDRTLMTETSLLWQNSKQEAQDLLNQITQEEQDEEEWAAEMDAEAAQNEEALNALLSSFEETGDDGRSNEYYALLGIDTTQLDAVIPDDANLDWLNALLAHGDSLLADTTELTINDAAYDALLAQSDSVLADSEEIDVKATLRAVLQDQLSYVDDSGEEIIFYQVAVTELSNDLAAGCDTTILSMTEGPDVLLLSNESEGVTILIDEYNNIATVIISHEVVKKVSAYMRKASKQNDFVEAMKKAAQNINNLTNAIKSFVEGAIDEVDGKVKKLKGSIADIESQKSAVLSKSAGTQMKIQDIERQLRTLKSQKIVNLDEYKKVQNQIAKLSQKRQSLLKEFNRLDNLNKGLTKQLNKMHPLMVGAAAALVKLNELRGIASGLYDFVAHIGTAIHDFQRWKALIDAIEPCPGDAVNASKLKTDCQNDWSDIAWSKGYYPSIALTGIATTANAVMFARKDLKWLLTFVGGMLTNFLDNTASELYANATNASTQWYPKRYKQYENLKCEKKKEPTPDPPKPNWPRNDGGDDGDDEDTQGRDFDPISPIHDPSGYVYEAIPSNRVEGVQATIYYKETVEDMYGDPYENIVLWDAEEYAQQNPLFTDENGMYQWDVPQGLWQVKFEKDGYVTAYSEWLPVPPPQLDVNMGIVQNKQPEVVEARAYEEGVEVQFDKFMDLSTLTTDNIYVTANDRKLAGTISLVDVALADEYADEADEAAVRYASRIRFVPDEPLSVTTGEIRLTISRNVRSYAGISMTDVFSQVLDVEKEVQFITANDVKVLYGSEKEVTIYALPYEAAVGRTLHIASASELITSVDQTEVTLDEEGKATVMVKGNLPGYTQLSFSMDGVTATGTCAVDVVTELVSVDAPTATRASGTTVYRGTQIELTTTTPNGVIYYTTDGSCPCDEDGSRQVYTGPIVIQEDTHIIAMTAVGTNNQSETVEFDYTLKRSEMDFALDEGWTWVSHNFESPVAVGTLATDESVRTIQSQTQEARRDSLLGMTGDLQSLNAAESYKVLTSASTQRMRLSDVAWNPATPIALTSGWNWIGYPVSQTMSVDEALATTDCEPLDVIVGQNGFAQFDGTHWQGTLETLSPGLGYMYVSQSPKNVNYNTTIVSNVSALTASGVETPVPLVLDIHKYPSVMPVVATLLRSDSSIVDNADYQVYAFCGTECRGLGQVVHGLVMISVLGNDGDEITFQAAKTDGTELYETSTVLTLGEQVVGNITSPYVMTIDHQTDLQNFAYEGNIFVCVVGDRLVIKGVVADRIDWVDVYDVSGHKLIHDAPVSKSGVMIPQLNPGVYVVVVHSNGEYTYHKVVRP